MPEHLNGEVLEDTAGVMASALQHIACREDCFYADWPDDPDRPKPCDCAPCVAKRALRTVGKWRFRCSREYRMETNLRERALVEAWEKDANDHRLAGILGQDEPPSIRDWYVATSIIRWLGTNVGSCILTEAGWVHRKEWAPI